MPDINGTYRYLILADCTISGGTSGSNTFQAKKDTVVSVVVSGGGRKTYSYAVTYQDFFLKINNEAELIAAREKLQVIRIYYQGNTATNLKVYNNRSYTGTEGQALYSVTFNLNYDKGYVRSVYMSSPPFRQAVIAEVAWNTYSFITLDAQEKEKGTYYYYTGATNGNINTVGAGFSTRPNEYGLSSSYTYLNANGTTASITRVDNRSSISFSSETADADKFTMTYTFAYGTNQSISMSIEFAVERY